MGFELRLFREVANQIEQQPARELQAAVLVAVAAVPLLNADAVIVSE